MPGEQSSSGPGSRPAPFTQDVAGDLVQDATAPDRAAPDGVEPGPVTPTTADAVVDELEDRWRRAAADLDNLRKRYTRELDRERAAERTRVAAAFLPVLDNLELALTYARSDPGVIVEGVVAVADQAVAVLAGLGYARRDEVGVPFDPGRHQVTTVVDAPDVEPGTVVQVLRAGYGDEPHQLRPASVAVSRRAG